MNEIDEEEFEEVLIFQEGVDKIEMGYWLKEGMRWVVYSMIAFVLQEVLDSYFSDVYSKFILNLVENNKIDFFEILNPLNRFNILFRLIVILVEAGLIGIANFLVMRTHLKNAIKWIYATIVGYLLFDLAILIFGNKLALSYGVDIFFSFNVITLLFLLTINFLISYSQYWVLKSMVRKAWLWIASSLLITFLLYIINLSQPLIGRVIVELTKTFIMMYLLRDEFLDHYASLEEEPTPA